jgi:MerR family transcriptional regulator/heat shock protein HspR
VCGSARGEEALTPKKKAGYMISAVAETYKVHPQTLRLYERLGLLQPSRSDGNTRLYVDKDLERLETVLNLTRELGVNLAGVEVILNMREKMERMQKELEEILAFVHENLTLPEKAASRDALVPVPPSNLIRSGSKKR